MITNRELFCSVVGVIISTLPKDYTMDLIYQSAEEFNISKTEAQKIIVELRKTLAYSSAQLLKKIKGQEDTTNFGV